jgi:hypothetical protein
MKNKNKNEKMKMKNKINIKMDTDKFNSIRKQKTISSGIIGPACYTCKSDYFMLEFEKNYNIEQLNSILIDGIKLPLNKNKWIFSNDKFISVIDKLVYYFKQ